MPLLLQEEIGMVLLILMGCMVEVKMGCLVREGSGLGLLRMFGRIERSFGAAHS